MLHMTSPTALALLAVAAFTAPLAAAALPAFRMPSAILEMFCGLAAGRSGLHVIGDGETLRAMTQVGLLYLMFLAGLEVRFPTRHDPSAIPVRIVLPLAAGSLVATTALSLAAGHLLYAWSLISQANIASLVLATTSLGIVVPTLKDGGIIGSPLGQTLVWAAFFADAGTVLFAAAALHPDEAPVVRIVLLLVLFPVAGVLLYGGGRLALERLHPGDRVVRQSQLGVRGALAILSVCSALAAELHAEVFLGGFAAGLICSLLARDHHTALRKKLETLGYGVCLPLFFISAGLRLDLTRMHLTSVVSMLPAYIIVALLVKFGAGLALVPRFGWRDATAAGALMSARFTLVMAVAVIAEQSGVITGNQEGALIATALATVILAPPLFHFLRRKESHGMAG